MSVAFLIMPQASDPTLDERLLVLGVLVFGVLSTDAVFLASWIRLAISGRLTVVISSAPRRSFARPSLDGSGLVVFTNRSPHGEVALTCTTDGRS